MHHRSPYHWGVANMPLGLPLHSCTVRPTVNIGSLCEPLENAKGLSKGAGLIKLRLAETAVAQMRYADYGLPMWSTLKPWPLSALTETLQVAVAVLFEC